MGREGGGGRRGEAESQKQGWLVVEGVGKSRGVGGREGVGGGRRVPETFNGVSFVLPFGLAGIDVDTV